MNNYTRGQETFLNRIFSFVHNIIRLLLVCLLLGITFFCVVSYIKLPPVFFSIEAQIFKLVVWIHIVYISGTFCILCAKGS